MAQRQISDDSNDFEVLPRHSNKYGDYMSIDSAASGDGDPYEKRRDIVVSKIVVEELRKKLNFESAEKIDELQEKLKSRDALDAGIGDEVANLDAISKNIESEELTNAAQKAREYVTKVRKLAIEKKTTVKRALDILEITLPVFILACDLSKDDTQLSEEFPKLQEEYDETKKEIMRCQLEFEMEKREEKLQHGKALLLRSISAATDDRKKMADKLLTENSSGNIERFSQAQSDVELIIGTEREELDAWLVSCRGDYSNIKSAAQEQGERHEDATKKFQSRLQSIEVNLEVNRGRQADLVRQLEELKNEEKRLENNRMFEIQVQDKAKELNTKVLDELESLRNKIADIQDNASTAQEIMLNMQLCSELLFEKAFEMQRIKEDKLRQLQMEALIRERNALSSCAVEFKMQMRMAEDNMKEYGEQLEDIRKEIERAAKKGQGITVSRKKRDLEEYQGEIEKEKKTIRDNDEKYKELMERMAEVDEELQIYGVSSPSIDALVEQRMAAMHLDSTGPMSLVSM